MFLLVDNFPFELLCKNKDSDEYSIVAFCKNATILNQLPAMCQSRVIGPDSLYIVVNGEKFQRHDLA